MRVVTATMICTVLMAACVGCQSAGKPAVSPTIHVEWSAYAGTAIGSPTTKPVDPSNGWRVHTTLLALATDPGQVLAPLSARGRLFAQPALGDPVLSSPQLTRNVRIGSDDAARQWFNNLQVTTTNAPIGLVESSAVLPEGVTLGVNAAMVGAQVELRLNDRDAKQLELLVVVQGRVPAPADSDKAAANRSAGDRFARESVLVDPIELDTNHPIVVVIPVEMGQTAAIVARFDLSLQSADESFTHAAERTRVLLDRSRTAVSELPSLLPTRNDAWGSYEFALRRADEPMLRRSSLNYVAAQTGSTIAHDLIVAADDQTLGDYAKLLLRSMTESTLQREPALLGWLMDLSALQLCADRAAGGLVPSEMASVLTIHAGEAGRNTASLGELIKGVESREELLTRLTVENMIYLEDSSPASRVRAFDWLAARARAPAGYDPLGPLQQRRDALERAQTATTLPTTPPITPGVTP